jgi:hypothetical protein
MTTEIWREIPGYEGVYSVSDLGRVLSHPRKTTRGGTRKLSYASGYPSVHLSKDGVGVVRTVHSLIMDAFVGPPPAGMMIRHKDGISAHSVLSNLEYGTNSENVLDQVEHGTHHNMRKEFCPHGHEYTAENTYRNPSQPGSRKCRACLRHHNRTYVRPVRKPRQKL